MLALMKSRIGVALLALVIAVAIVDCRQLVGIDDRSLVGPCDACVHIASCTDETRECGADAACSPRASCMSACAPGAADCQARCVNVPSYGAIEPVASYESCRATRCGEACQVTCGDVPVLVADSAASACTQCVATSCCDAERACAAAADCWRVAECVRARTAPDAQLACRTIRYDPGATSAYAALEGCVQGHCFDDCDYGNDWSCVGHVAWPLPIGNTFTHTFHIVDATDPTHPIAGVEARICLPSDPACAAPVFTRPTNANGDLTITFDTRSVVGSRHGFDGFLFMDDPSKRYVRSIFQADPPFAEDGATSVHVLTTPAIAGGLAAVVGEKYVPAAGQVLVLVHDCAGRNARGVTISFAPSDPSAKIYYFKGGLPSRAATETDSSGNAVIFNAPPGILTLTIFPKELGGAAAGHVSTLVQIGEPSGATTGAISQTLVLPSPR
jgi:hypothetical protein